MSRMNGKKTQHTLLYMFWFNLFFVRHHLEDDGLNIQTMISDEKYQGEDRPKQAGSCWFARPCWLATIGANLHPPDVWFEDVMTSSFSLVSPAAFIISIGGS